MSDNTGGRLIVSGTEHTLAANGVDQFSLTFFTSGLTAGTYNYTINVTSSDPGVVGLSVPVKVVVGGGLATYQGNISGYVGDDGSDGDSDPGSPFYASYTGPMTVTVKKNTDGTYYVTVVGTGTQSTGTENFNSQINVAGNVPSLSNISFKPKMGDHCTMNATISITATAITGSWYLSIDTSDDHSDVGQGSFNLTLVSGSLS